MVRHTRTSSRRIRRRINFEALLISLTLYLRKGCYQ